MFRRFFSSLEHLKRYKQTVKEFYTFTTISKGNIFLDLIATGHVIVRSQFIRGSILTAVWHLRKKIRNKLGLSCAKLSQRCVKFGPIYVKEFFQKILGQEIFLVKKYFWLKKF